MENVNRLVRIAEFQKVLENYQPSKASNTILHDTHFVLMVGPTAAGRNTLINLLVETGRYHFVISNTTRKPRTNNGVMEQDGVEYWFTAEEEFLQRLQSGEFLEAAIIHGQQVSGISIDELDMARKSGKIAIDEIEVEGAANIHRQKPDALFVFLLPPTFDIWMQRLRGRGEMPEDEVRRRLESAQEEIARALAADYYHFVINNEIHEAAVAVDELANGRIPDSAKQELGRNYAEQLAIDIQLYLGTE